MDRRELAEVLAAVEAGALSADEAAARLARAPFEDLGYAKPDLARGMRQGVGEVVYGEGKTASQIEGICRALAEGGQPRVLVTRVDEAKAASLAAALPAFAYRPEARLGIVGGLPAAPGAGRIVVAAAGTSDVPVAEEAAVTAEFLGNDVVRCYDVGVAGIHRLFACADELAQARVVVAVAGMEGALPSVVAGLVACPVVAVPTSVGYGASFGGVTALLAMLNSCASGVSVVNIDNGFGAGYQASLINHLGISPGLIAPPASVGAWPAPLSSPRHALRAGRRSRKRQGKPAAQSAPLGARRSGAERNANERGQSGTDAVLGMLLGHQRGHDGGRAAGCGGERGRAAPRAGQPAGGRVLGTGGPA